MVIKFGLFSEKGLPSSVVPFFITMDNERIITYLAISNLIITCKESLEAIEKMPNENISKEDIDVYNFILSVAIPLEEKLANELNDHQIPRPNWDNLK